MNEPKPLITTGAAARMLGVSQKTIRDWTKKGKIGVVVLPSGHRRLWRAEVEAILRHPSGTSRR